LAKHNLLMLGYSTDIGRNNTVTTNEMGEACVTYVGVEKCIQNFEGAA
jgi:hypothetical protein